MLMVKAADAVAELSLSYRCIRIGGGALRRLGGPVGRNRRRDLRNALTDRLSTARHHPRWGARASSSSAARKQALNIEVEAGALVLDVATGGPAAAAGVQKGDVVVALAGKPVDSIEDLYGALRATEPGQQVPLTIARPGRLERQQLTITIGTQN